MGSTSNQQPVEAPTSATVAQLIAVIAQKDEKIATLERHLARLIDELGQLRDVKFGEDVAKRTTRSVVDGLLSAHSLLPFDGLNKLQDQVAATKQDAIAQAVKSAVAGNEATDERSWPSLPA